MVESDTDKIIAQFRHKSATAQSLIFRNTAKHFHEVVSKLPRFPSQATKEPVRNNGMNSFKKYGKMVTQIILAWEMYKATNPEILNFEIPFMLQELGYEFKDLIKP